MLERCFTEWSLRELDKWIEQRCFDWGIGGVIPFIAVLLEMVSICSRGLEIHELRTKA